MAMIKECPFCGMPIIVGKKCTTIISDKKWSGNWYICQLCGTRRHFHTKVEGKL